MRVLVSKPKNLEIAEFPEGYAILYDEKKVEEKKYLFGLIRDTNVLSAMYIRLVHALSLLRSASGYDVILSGKMGELYAVIRALVPPLSRKPLIILDIEWNTEHRTRARKAFSSLHHRLIARGSSWLRTYSASEKARYSEYYGIDPNKFIFIPYCAQLPEPPEGCHDDGTIFTGGHHRRDSETFLRALGDFPAPIVIAAGADRWPQDHLSGNMTLTGVLPFVQFVEKMRQSRLVVLSLSTGRLQATGIRTYVYAMSLGKCVIVNDPEGTRGYIQDGLNGAIVSPGDPEALRARVEELYYDDARRKEIERHAQAWARQNATASACLGRVSALVNGLLNRP